MHAVIRRYNAFDGKSGAVAQKVHDEFLPLVSQVQGFIAYYLIDAGDGAMASVGVFESKAGADESTRLAADWVRQHLTHVIKSAPVILAGEVAAQRAAALR
ncbi:MAG TPA: hypothetical protein VFS05_13825 [Gemmatimonadaceae bacterium]|nr:hypothetical protein [Gemmatimonadaceae bacterium]